MTDMDTLVEVIASRLTAQRGDFYRPGVWLALLQLLAQGQPAAISQIAEAVGQSLDAVAKILSCCVDLEMDAHHNIVGMGLSLNPTPHRFQINGHPLYTWCALDSLMYVIALGQAAEMRSTCPVTQAEIRLRIKPDDITDLDPATAVLSIVMPAETNTCWRNNFCNQGYFFSTAEAARQWLGNQPEAYILPVNQAFVISRQIVIRLYPSTPS